MAHRLIPVGPTGTRSVDEGRVSQVAWDKSAWTILAEMRRSGQRLLQIPPYDARPRVGDPIQLTGRHPLVGVQINGVQVFDLSQE